MIKFVKKFGIFLFVSCVSVSSFAKDDSIDNDEHLNKDYDADYYENEGNLVFKIRVNGLQSNGKQKSLPQASSGRPVSTDSFIKNGYGLDASTSIFFSSNIAAELSLGFDVLRTTNSNLANIANNYGGNSANIGKRKDIYMIPLTLTGQYHIAPYGAIRPYVGLGYHGAYFYTKSKGFKVKNGHGAVLQAGIDFYAKDDTLINLDIRQYFLNTKVDYKTNITAGQLVTSKVKFNPLLISVGVGFKF